MDLRKELCLDLTQQHLDLTNELHLDMTQQHLDEISVDELKILNDDELFDIAFQASQKGGNITRDNSQLAEECFNGTTNNERVQDADHACSVKSGIDEDYVPTNDNLRRSARIRENEKMKKQEPTTNKAPTKNKKVTKNDKTHEEDYMVELEKLAAIKQKQEEDKLSASLHSFCGTSGPVSLVTLSETKERMSSFNHPSLSTQVKSSNTREHIPLHNSEILLCVEVYNRSRSWVKNQEILVLGQQFLSELRDKLYCLSDEIMKTGNKYDPSGYFLIEDIFYNDLRKAGAIDYSKPILDWLRDSKKTAQEKWECITSGLLLPKEKEYLGSGSGPKMPQFKARLMQKTRFCDINFRLGTGYLYCHQGECKHLMVIRDMRLIHPEDVQNRAAYPLILFQSKLRFQKCSVCKIFKAVKVTTDDKWAPENPCYFCDACYYMLHYKDGQLLYEDFNVFDYIHD